MSAVWVVVLISWFPAGWDQTCLLHSHCCTWCTRCRRPRSRPPGTCWPWVPRRWPRGLPRHRRICNYLVRPRLRSEPTRRRCRWRRPHPSPGRIFTDWIIIWSLYLKLGKSKLQKLYCQTRSSTNIFVNFTLTASGLQPTSIVQHISQNSSSKKKTNVHIHILSYTIYIIMYLNLLLVLLSIDWRSEEIIQFRTFKTNFLAPSPGVQDTC